jgi:CrcB protein
MFDIVSVFIGGVAGSAARAAITEQTATLLGLLIVNVIGSFLLGILVGWRMRTGSPARVVVNLAGIGFLGSFTTFSAVAVSIADTTGGRVPAAAAFFAVGSVALGLGLARLGLFAGGRW